MAADPPPSLSNHAPRLPRMSTSTVHRPPPPVPCSRIKERKSQIGAHGLNLETTVSSYLPEMPRPRGKCLKVPGPSGGRSDIPAPPRPLAGPLLPNPPPWEGTTQRFSARPCQARDQCCPRGHATSSCVEPPGSVCLPSAPPCAKEGGPFVCFPQCPVLASRNGAWHVADTQQTS